MTHRLTVAIMGAALALTSCTSRAPDPMLQARIFGCLDVAGPELSDGDPQLRRGLGCDELDERDVRAALPAWRASQANARRAAAR
jgi:hypothetical protein